MVSLLSSGAATSWGNMPSATTEFRGSTAARQRVDFTGLTQFRLVANQQVAGWTTARLRAEYSLNGTTWVALENGGTSVGDLNASAAAVVAGSYVSIASAAQTDVYLRVVGHSGNGNADPSWSQLGLQAK